MSKLPNYAIHQLYPAPGFRAIRCYVSDDGQAIFEDLAVIGWAVMRDPEPEPRSVGDHLLTHDELESYVWSEGEGAMSTRDLYNMNGDEVFVLGPGQDLTDERKAEFEQSARRARVATGGLHA